MNVNKSNQAIAASGYHTTPQAGSTYIGLYANGGQAVVDITVLPGRGANLTGVTIEAGGFFPCPIATWSVTSGSVLGVIEAKMGG